jgi:cytochrome c-type biogenesis protein CcmH/NrfG
MKRTIEPNIETASPLAQVRALLTDLERQLVVMQETPSGARDVIVGVDAAEQMLAGLSQPGVDLRAEENRLDFVRRRLTGGAPGVARLVQAANLADDLRDSPTWRAIQAAQAAQARGRLRRLLFIGVPLLALFLTIIVLNLLFPAPPRANLTLASRQLEQGQIDQALATARAEAARVPTDPEPHLLIGAIATQQGNTAEAETAWAEARRLMADDTQFFFQRGTALLELGLPDAAEADARQLITNEATAAPGYLLLGGVEETRGRVPEAVAAFEEAARIAATQNNAQLEVIAKTRIGILMQQAPMLAPTPGT